LKNKNIVIVYPILKVLSVLIVIIAGILLFRATIDIQTIIGIVLGVISIYLLSKKVKK
jgi:multidrug transporter EmrE-like cation transporter